MNGKRAVKIISILFGLILVVFTGSPIYGQNDDAVASLLSSSDKNKIDKANQYKTQGDALIEEANQLYMETFSVQADINLDEKAIKKKVNQLETKAQQKQFEALELYKKCDETKYAIYKKYIEKFWSDFNGDESQYVNAKLIEEQSNDYFYQATTTRNDAGKLKDRKEKIQKLNDANDLDIRAIEKQVTALGIYYSLETPTAQATTPQPQTPAYKPAQTTETPAYTQPVQTQTTPVESPSYTTSPSQSVSGNTQVNQEILDMYKRFVSDTVNTGKIVLTPELLSNISSYNADQILNLWYNYAYGQAYSPEFAQQLQAKNEVDTSGIAAEDRSAEQYQEYQDKDVQEKASEAQQAAQTELKLAEIHEGEEDKLNLIPTDENVIYRVQLAANKAELTQRALQKIYYGNKQVEMIMDDGWFKYSIGDFDDYKSADKFRSQCGVKNAFIVAYRKGTHFISPEEQEIVSSVQKSVQYAVSPESEGLTFRVQIAASHTTLNKEQIAKIYGGSYPVELIEEDGWYKYQIPGVRLFSDAIKIIRDTKVKGSFINAYNNNDKMNLLDAVKMSKKIEKEIQTYGRRGRIKDVEFYVQVAASQIPLREDELAKIYSGSYKTTLMIEDGWYKYRIKAGNSYEEAENIKTSTGVSKAFIVAYDRAAKISLYQAREKAKQYN